MHNELDYLINQLKKLTSIPSPTGFTKQVSSYLIEQLKEMGYQPEQSNKGNVSVVLGGNGNPLLLSAHVDTLGAMVRSIKSNGRLRPIAVGGHKWATADGENCTIFTRDGRSYTGVVLNNNPSSHVAEKELEHTEVNMEILLDENVSTAEETKALGIQNGDFIALDPRTTVTSSGYIKSRFLDDKLSTAILLTLAKHIADTKTELNRKVTLLFTVYEEVGHGGAVIPEDTTEMIAVDMGCVGEDLSCTERMVSICAKDSASPYDYNVVSALAQTASKHGLNYAIDIYPHYGSDADVALRSGHDIRHGLIGPGVYASHNYERSHIDGARNTYELLKAYIL